jgi:hypothetical protein
MRALCDLQAVAGGFDRAAVSAFGTALGADGTRDVRRSGRIDRNRPAIAIGAGIGGNDGRADTHGSRVRFRSGAVQIPADQHPAATGIARRVQIRTVRDRDNIAAQCDRAAGLARIPARGFQGTGNARRSAVACVEDDLAVLH